MPRVGSTAPRLDPRALPPAPDAPWARRARALLARVTPLEAWRAEAPRTAAEVAAARRIVRALEQLATGHGGWTEMTFDRDGRLVAVR